MEVLLTPIALTLAILASTAEAGRPAVVESQRQDWVDWLIQDGDRRFQQGQLLAAVGAGVVFIGAGVSLGDFIESGRTETGVRPGAVLAMAGGPLLLAGLPSMAAGAGRMRKAMRMERVIVPNVPLVGAWSMIGAGVVLIPAATLVWTIPPHALMFGAGLTALGSYGLATAQYRLNLQADFPRPWVYPVPMHQGAGLGITARW